MKIAATAATAKPGWHAVVLIVDDEQSVLAETQQIIEALGLSAFTAQSVADAIRVVSTTQIDVALLDWRLKGQEDGIALGRVLWRDYGIPFVVFSGYLNTRATSNAHQLGAADVVDKPLIADTLQSALHLALQRRADARETTAGLAEIRCGADSCSQVWARVVLNACRAAKDPRKEEDIAKASNMSISVYREICAACGVGGKQTTDLARFIRAQSRSKERGSMLGDHLSIRDRRTRKKLFDQAGVPLNSRFVPLRAFLLSQTFIPTTRECLHELAHLAANDPLFFVEFAAAEASQAAALPLADQSVRVESDSSRLTSPQKTPRAR